MQGSLKLGRMRGGSSLFGKKLELTEKEGPSQGFPSSCFLPPPSPSSFTQRGIKLSPSPASSPEHTLWAPIFKNTLGVDPWILPKRKPDTFLLLFCEWRTLWTPLTWPCYRGKRSPWNDISVDCGGTRHAHRGTGTFHQRLPLPAPSQPRGAVVRTCRLWGAALWAGRSAWASCSRGWPRRCRSPAAPRRATHKTQKGTLATTSPRRLPFSTLTVKYSSLVPRYVGSMNTAAGAFKNALKYILEITHTKRSSSQAQVQHSMRFHL